MVLSCSRCPVSVYLMDGEREGGEEWIEAGKEVRMRLTDDLNAPSSSYSSTFTLFAVWLSALHMRGGGFSSSFPQTWAGFVTGFGQWNAVEVTSQDLKTSGAFLLFLLELCWNAEWISMIWLSGWCETHGPVTPSQPTANHPPVCVSGASGWPTSWSQMQDWAQSRSAKPGLDLPSWPKVSQSVINACCF